MKFVFSMRGIQRPSIAAYCILVSLLLGATATGKYGVMNDKDIVIRSGVILLLKFIFMIDHSHYNYLRHEYY